MKPPKCRTCGHRHPSGHAVYYSSPSDSPKGPGGVIENAGDAQRRSAPLDMCPNGHVSSGASRGGDITDDAPLTNAQKQKAYRERGGAALREYERLRKARRRKELKDQ